MQQKLYREELLQIFPQKLRQRIEESVTFRNLTEIRLRADLPVLIETTQENYFLKKEEAAEKRRAIAKEVFGDSHVDEVAAKHHLPVLAKCPIDPQLAALSDAGMIETYGGQFLEGAADACEKLLK